MPPWSSRMVAMRCLSKSTPTIACHVTSGCQIGMSLSPFLLQTSQRPPKSRRAWVRRSRKPSEPTMKPSECRETRLWTKLQLRLLCSSATLSVLQSAGRSSKFRLVEQFNTARSPTEKMRNIGSHLPRMAPPTSTSPSTSRTPQISLWHVSCFLSSKSPRDMSRVPFLSLITTEKSLKNWQRNFHTLAERPIPMAFYKSVSVSHKANPIIMTIELG